MYLHYLATQKENEMIHTVFISQWKHPVKDDLTEEVKVKLKELDIRLSLDEIKAKYVNSFKRLVKIKAKEFTLNYLLEMKEKHSKMENLSYTELKLQQYLKNDDIPTEEAKNLYRFRTRSAYFKENMKNGFLSTACPFCLVQPDNQVHSVKCVQ